MTICVVVYLVGALAAYLAALVIVASDGEVCRENWRGFPQCMSLLWPIVVPVVLGVWVGRGIYMGLARLEGVALDQIERALKPRQVRVAEPEKATHDPDPVLEAERMAEEMLRQERMN